MSLKLPFELGRYQLVEQIAEGGMAEVYRAVSNGKENFKKEFAIKLIAPQFLGDSFFISLLIDEANIQSQLDHDNIVKIFELDSLEREGEEPLFYLVMEYVRGIDLSQFWQKIVEGKQNIPYGYSLFIVEEILKGLKYAHTKRDDFKNSLNIVHQDISPQNILISYDGRVKITDFGIAKAKLEYKKSSQGHFSQRAGKCAYMSPEQALCSERLDHRADLFSTGIILFELLTGARVFPDEEDDSKILNLVREAEYNREALEYLDVDLAALVKQSLEKDPLDRYQTAQEFLDALWKLKQTRGIHVTDQDLGTIIKSLFPQDGSESYPLKPKTPSPQSKPIEVTKPDVTVAEKILEVEESSENDLEEKIVPNKKRISWWKWLCLGLASLPLLILFLLQFSFEQKESKVELPKFDVADYQIQGIALGPPAPKEKSEIQKSHLNKGFLSIVAVPWGYVEIPKFINKRETPVSESLEPGKYQLKLWHQKEGKKQSLNIEIIIQAGKRTRCFGSFEAEPPRLTCN